MEAYAGIGWAGRPKLEGFGVRVSFGHRSLWLSACLLAGTFDLSRELHLQLGVTPWLAWANASSPQNSTTVEERISALYSGWGLTLEGLIAPNFMKLFYSCTQFAP